MKIRALVFDAYGTLLDVHSVVALCEQIYPSHGVELSRLWRAKQLEYTWLRSLMGRYEDFSRITADALRHACAALALKLEPPRLVKLMDAYDRLQPFPDALEALPALARYKRAILSNGSTAMLAAAVKSAGLGPHLDAVLSVDALKVYKPDPRVYQLAVDTLAVERQEIGFVSSNYWDVAGAKAFGFNVFWINRGVACADELGMSPDAALQHLGMLLTHLDA